MKKINMLFVISTALVVTMTLIIFAFSSQQGETSVSISGGIIDLLIEKFRLESLFAENAWLYENRNYVFRKLLHFTEYAVLSTFMFTTLKLKGLSLRYASTITLIFVTVVATADEYYQSFILGRSSHIRDVFIDVLGGLIAVCIANGIILLTRIFNKKAK